MKTYIKYTIIGNYIQFPNELYTEPQEECIGSTYEDFLNNKWVLLNDDQIKFHENNPKASIEEVLNMEFKKLNVKKTLDQVKQDVIDKIRKYDLSKSINSFVVNGTYAWLTTHKRSDYKNSIDSAKLLGINTVSFYIEDNIYTITVNQAELLLASILLYANACYINTKKHIIAIKNANSIEEIENYDYTTGYPDRLTFEL